MKAVKRVIQKNLRIILALTAILVVVVIQLLNVTPAK